MFMLYYQLSQQTHPIQPQKPKKLHLATQPPTITPASSVPKPNAKLLQEEPKHYPNKKMKYCWIKPSLGPKMREQFWPKRIPPTPNVRPSTNLMSPRNRNRNRLSSKPARIGGMHYKAKSVVGPGK